MKLFIAVVLVALCAVTFGAAQISTPPEVRFNTFLQTASLEFDVPQSVLVDLVKSVGDTNKNCDQSNRYPGAVLQTSVGLNAAACLLDLTPAEVYDNPVDNIRGTAAILSFIRFKKAKKNKPTDWDAVVKEFRRTHLVGAVINLLSELGLFRLQCILFGGVNVFNPAYVPNSKRSNLECPDGLTCEDRTIVLAYPPPQVYGKYQWNTYGNWDKPPGRIPCGRQFIEPKEGEPRSNMLDVCQIVIHDTEVDAKGTLNAFNNPAYSASAHYLVLSNGTVYQLVPTQAISWHALANYNFHSIGIEHEGFVDQPDKWYGDAQYAASSKLVRWLAKRYNIPMQRSNIFGHMEANGNNRAKQRAEHYDPGSYWDWNRYFAFMSSPLESFTRSRQPLLKDIVTIDLDYETNIRTYTSASPNPQVGPHKANSLPVYNSPGTADGNTTGLLLFSDAGVREKAGQANALNKDVSPALIVPGIATMEQADWGKNVYTGRSYYRRAHVNNWSQIDYAGYSVWFYNPDEIYTRRGQPNTNVARLITPKAERVVNGSIKVFATAFPKTLSYTPGQDWAKNPAAQGLADGFAATANGIPAPVASRIFQDNTLMYLIPANQYYVAYERIIANQVLSYDPFNQTHWQGMYYESANSSTTSYYRISFNSRWAYVDAADVTQIGA